MLKIPVDSSAAPKQRFDNLLKGLLSVQTAELQKIEAAITAVQKEKERRRKAPR